jgi:hypothetical protein
MLHNEIYRYLVYIYDPNYHCADSNGYYYYGSYKTLKEANDCGTNSQSPYYIEK